MTDFTTMTTEQLRNLWRFDDTLTSKEVFELGNELHERAVQGDDLAMDTLWDYL